MNILNIEIRVGKHKFKETSFIAMLDRVKDKQVRIFLEFGFPLLKVQ